MNSFAKNNGKKTKMKTAEQKNKVDLSYYLGTWVNSYEKARVIESFTFSENNGKIQMTVKNSKVGFYSGNWGSGELKPHSYAPDTNDVVAFQARFELEDMDAFLAINENKGLLIIAAYFTFKQSDDRSDCFVREFFYKI
ncbi:MAG: hypothetical protein COA88_15550 [Kordia sp.]|nr:MAG: hypothetical protein COA88_15550 [Kordia sp.]